MIRIATTQEDRNIYFSILVEFDFSFFGGDALSKTSIIFIYKVLCRVGYYAMNGYGIARI
jgi:hypothetical protein